MLSVEEHPGIIAFMVGLIIIVMSAIGLSMLVDRRFEFSSNDVNIQREIETGALEVDDLNLLYGERCRNLLELGSRLNADSLMHKEIQVELKALQLRCAALDISRRELVDELAKVENDFLDYRKNYRRWKWADAVGEGLGDFLLRDGREYKQAIVTRVTDVGLEIRHADGIARIQAPDLDQKMQDRFQWSEEERRKVLNEEMINLQRADDPVAGYPKPVERVVIRPQTRNQPDPGELVALRRQVTGWQLKISQLRSEQSVARSHSGYGNQTSVPGSLETWSAKADRLGRELARAQVALETAKSNLAAIAPSDSLLLSTPRDP